MEDVVRSQCRLPVEVDRWLKSRAKAEGRSKNAQLVSELKKLMAADLAKAEATNDSENGESA
jgi:hypothetical protein